MANKKFEDAMNGSRPRGQGISIGQVPTQPVHTDAVHTQPIRKEKSVKVNKTISLPLSVVKMIEEMAAATDDTNSGVIAKAVKEYYKRYLAQEEGQ